MRKFVIVLSDHCHKTTLTDTMKRRSLPDTLALTIYAEDMDIATLQRYTLSYRNVDNITDHYRYAEIREVSHGYR